MTNANDNDERKIVSSLRDLPTSVRPPRDLWAGIEARIVAEGHIAAADAGTRKRAGSNPSRLRWMAAAAVVAALAVGMWVGRSVLPTTHQLITSPGEGTSATVTPPRTNDGAAALQAAYIVDPKYRKQREALVKSLEAQLVSLPPESRAKVISSLATIHKSMQDLEAELGKDPSNALLQELLVNTYQDEMRVLTTVHEASDAGEGI
jgi:N-acyl-D-aspartate/D-glutamate deacylase